MENKRKVRNFIAEVLENMVADPLTKERIESDLYCHIMEAIENVEIDVFLQQMGTPQEIASEFMQNMYDTNADLVQKIIKDRKPHPPHSGPPPHHPLHLHPSSPPHHPHRVGLTFEKLNKEEKSE